ncbi:MAG: c-type cytochrome [Phycisphaerales bacterium]|nr:c-type cytochrome [Phycisphaerales bacterium]
MTLKSSTRIASFVALPLLVTPSAGADDDAPAGEDGIVSIPSTPQREGDPQAGREYLLYGDYVGSGFPYDIFVELLNAQGGGTPRLERAGRSAPIPHEFNAFKTPEGVEVVGGFNCLGCHAAEFRGELVIGMGNSFSDWSDAMTPTRDVRLLIASRYGVKSAEWEASHRLLRGMDATAGFVRTPFAGVNPAFRLEEAAAAHRRPKDLTWSEERLFQPTRGVIASDVPPWWHLKKKHALYYTGMGRGDFARLLQQIGVVGIKDAETAAARTASMADLLAYIRTLEPPVYPGVIDAGLAAEGERVFAANCKRCHGTYGESWTYPNRLVPVSEVGTDGAYAQRLIDSPLTRWFNESWFAGEDGTSAGVEPRLAYVAPPLDGVWCTAPYLHNASVPTLDTLLDSSKRPTYWRRSFDEHDYDLERVGWAYEDVPGAADASTYDTTRAGYGNHGHTYGDDLTDEERRALIEYLKSL